MTALMAGSVDPLPGTIVTAALDFGTARSGYAYTFRDRPMKIYTNNWHSGSEDTAKAPTIVLFEPDGKFKAFGFEAERIFSEMIEEGCEESSNEHKRWFYFQNFKMELYRKQKLTTDIELADIEGKKMSAIKIFSETIRHMKQALLRQAGRSVNGVRESDILWILTVPAIWSEPAKQFMRVAANQAGIDNSRLRLVLEPEAASIYCQVYSTLKEIGDDGVVKLSPFPVGYTYIVADLGGGTVDIATHQVISNSKLRELFRATGGDLGALKVDEKFNEFLTEVFGDDVMDDFHHRCIGSYLELMQDFNNSKKTVHFESRQTLRIRCPLQLADCVRKHKGKSIEDYIKEKDPGVVSMKGDKLILSPEKVDSLFKEVSDTIIQQLTIIFQQQTVEIKALLLVGGFANSLYLYEKIKRHFGQISPGIEITKPEESDLHVLRGAVLSTVLHTSIFERLSPFTYGLRAAVLFDEKKHPESTREIRSSGVYCSGIFEKFIEKNQPLTVGSIIRHRIETKIAKPASKFEDRCVELYRSADPDPKYTSEEGCERVAEIVLRHPKNGWPDKPVFDFEVEIGESEFQIHVVNGTTGVRLSATAEYLGD